MSTGMSVLFIDAAPQSYALALLQLAREPFIQVSCDDKHPHVPRPFIETKEGVIVGFHAILDYILNRVPHPPLIGDTPMRRAMHLSIFYHLMDRVHSHLSAAKELEIRQMLRTQRFFVGEEITICDAALCTVIVFSGTTDQVLRGYVNRCEAEFASFAAKEDADDDAA